MAAGSETGGRRRSSAPLYTAEQRRRRDESRWTLVQGVLAIAQFVVFAISLLLVLRFLITGEGWLAATISAIVKTALLYSIMVTGSLWEKDVYGRYLFAPAFFWEDVVSMAVIALHTAYIATLFIDGIPAATQMTIILAGYAVYTINAAQFLLKLRRARKDAEAEDQTTVGGVPA